MNEDRLIYRAHNAYGRELVRAERERVLMDQHAPGLTTVENDSGKTRVVLRNCNGVLAEYEWRNERLRKVS